MKIQDISLVSECDINFLKLKSIMRYIISLSIGLLFLMILFSFNQIGYKSDQKVENSLKDKLVLAQMVF